MPRKGGRVPTPTALKLVKGDDKKHPERINRSEPKPEMIAPDRPEDLADDVGEVWDRVIADLSFMGLAAAADQDSLKCYCEAVVVHRKASAVLAKSPVLIKGLHGGMVRNPAIVVQRDAALTICRFAQEFGLTPSSRTRIRVEEASGRASSATDTSNPFVAQG